MWLLVSRAFPLRCRGANDASKRQQIQNEGVQIIDDLLILTYSMYSAGYLDSRRFYTKRQKSQINSFLMRGLVIINCTCSVWFVFPYASQVCSRNNIHRLRLKCWLLYVYMCWNELFCFMMLIVMLKLTRLQTNVTDLEWSEQWSLALVNWRWLLCLLSWLQAWE